MNTQALYWFMEYINKITPLLFAGLVALPAAIFTAAPALATAETGTSQSADRRLAPGVDIGLWVWHKEELIAPAERARLIEFCRTYGITRLFIQVRFAGEGEQLNLADQSEWQALLAAANDAGVKVEALDGASSMGFAENRSDTLRRLDAVLAFHRAQPSGLGFAGLHYDIEPYTSARWRVGEHTAIMGEFLETAVAINAAVRAIDPKLTVSHDIPAFYDGQDKYIVEFNGAKKNFHEHVQDVSDYIGIMSYRRHATGPNSVAGISSTELAYAAKIGKPAYLSLETVPLPETPQITFHGRSEAEYRQTIGELADHLRGNPAFGGLLLHQYRTVRALLEGGTPAGR